MGTFGGPLAIVMDEAFGATATGVFGMLSRAEASRTTRDDDCTERAEAPRRGAGDIGVPSREEEIRPDTTVDMTSATKGNNGRV